MKINLLKTNAALKLLSLALATILWFFVISSKRSETVVEVPVRFVNIPQSLELIDHEKTINISLEGQQRLLRRLDRDDIDVVVDLRGFKGGRVSYYLSREDIRIPDSFEVKNIYPSKIDFTLKKRQK